MSRYFTEKYASLTPYTPGEQPRDMQYIKLNTNESPYAPAARVTRAAAEESGRLQLYSDPECVELRAQLAKVYGVRPEQILMTNGSDEVLNFAFMAFADERHPMAFADITYGFYSVFAELNHIPYTEIPLKEDYSIDPADYIGLGKMIVIANPNAPTGLCLPLADIEKIVQSNPDHVVIVDEAYVDFGCDSAVGLIREYPNLLVIQTASKSRSLAGLRVGWALGNEDLIAALRCVRDSINSYTVDRVAQAAAAAAIRDKAYFEKTRLAIMDTREKTLERLVALGFQTAPSKANFLFARHSSLPGKEIFQALRERGILVRRWDLPRIQDHLRISIGTNEEMTTLCTALEDILKR